MEIGLSKSTVNNWKNGGMPSDSTLQKIADYFGIPVERLEGQTDEKIPPAVQWNSDNDPVTNALIQEVLTASEEDKRKMLEIIRVIKGASY